VLVADPAELHRGPGRAGPGHLGQAGQAKAVRQAGDILAARVVFGVTSENSLDHMARAVITAYYGRPPAYSYYDGCSTGGREALMLAQRFPADFNGIIAGSPAMNMAPLNYLKYMAFLRNPPAGFTLADVRFTAREFVKVSELGNLIYNANNPDLRAFAAHGGKLIMYHGWADQVIPPWASLDYYAAVERTMGGFLASQSFSRLYMIPGGYHCLFGPGGSTVNLAGFLGKLIAWVQHGTAPDAVHADTFSIPQNKIIQYQTVRPYNALARVRPAKGSLNAHYHYIGRY
jgi:pimeloyl-ACP methyl ester carboxylesterase